MNAQISRPSPSPLEAAAVAASEAILRLEQAQSDSANPDFELAHRSASEALFWLCAVDEHLRGDDSASPERRSYDAEQLRDYEGEQLLGLRYLRNAITHDAIIATRSGARPFLINDQWDEAKYGPRPKGVIHISAVFSWPFARDLTPARKDPRALLLHQKYEEHLAGEGVGPALDSGLNWCWRKLAVWEPCNAPVPEGATFAMWYRRVGRHSSKQLECPECGTGLTQVIYPPDHPRTPSRHAFRCATTRCSHYGGA